MSSSCGETDKAVVDAQEGAPSRTARGDIVAGETYSAWWAFKRTTYTRFDEEGGSEVETWAPGWEYEAFGPEDSVPVWQGQGAQLRTVVAVYKPGRFPERVFYTRRWRDPDGKEFGRDGLRITTAEAFRRWRAEEHKARLLQDMHPWNREKAAAEFEALCRKNALRGGGGTPSTGDLSGLPA